VIAKWPRRRFCTKACPAATVHADARRLSPRIGHPGQPPLMLADDPRLEAAVSIAGHRDLHRADLGEHRLTPPPIAGVLPVTAGRITRGVAEMIVELALRRGLQHGLGQPGQQRTPTSQLQPLRPGPIGQLPGSTAHRPHPARPLRRAYVRSHQSQVPPTAQELHQPSTVPILSESRFVSPTRPAR
jgi:hypothetical protein